MGTTSAQRISIESTVQNGASHNEASARRFAFVMEQQAGMRTQYLNWRQVVENDKSVDPTWVPITYWQERGLIEKLRFVPGQGRAILRSYLQTGRGLAGKTYDAVLFNTFNPAVVHKRSVYDQRAFLMFDVTPVQYDKMGFWYEHKPDTKGWVARLKHSRVREVFRNATGLIAWSNWAAESAVTDYGADASRLHIVPPGIDVEMWCPAPEKRPTDGVVRILFTGGNFERKGGDLLLRWARETTKRGWELHLVTRDEVEPLPNVCVHNDFGSNSDELIALAQRCDLFALPTRADCYSIASLEAMSVGLPVITTTIGGIPDIVRDGDTGYLLAPDDYDGLKERLDTLIESESLRKRIGEAGRAEVNARYNVTTLVQSGLQVMRGARA